MIGVQLGRFDVPWPVVGHGAAASRAAAPEPIAERDDLLDGGLDSSAGLTDDPSGADGPDDEALAGGV